MRRPRGLRTVVLAAGLAVALAGLHVLPALAASEEPQWDTTVDAGNLGNDVARFVVTSPTLNMVNQGLDTVFVTGTSGKSPTHQALGVRDLDVGTTAYDADTGEVRWTAIYDRGLGIDDQIGAFEINFHNNLVYEMVNSGNDIVTIERAVRDGRLSRSAVYPGATVNGSAISATGGFLGVVGSKIVDQQVRFLALTYQTGAQSIEFEDFSVRGHANAADIPHTGSIGGPAPAQRTLIATGYTPTPGTGGEIYTVAYDYRTQTHEKRWERTWRSPHNLRDEGMATKAAHVTALGRAVGFVAGKTRAPAPNTSGNRWDIVVTAYDLITGEDIWSSPLIFDAAGRDDEPMFIDYSDETSTLYVTGTSHRGVPHGQDVVTLAVDAATGEKKSVAFAAGDISNGEDTPTGLMVSKDGTRVFVAANVHNLLSTGGRQAALFAYDSGLRPAGSRVVGGPGHDRSAGVAMNVAQDRVFLAGSTPDQTTGRIDHRVTSFAVDGFVLPAVDIPTEIAFTEESDTAGKYTDTATLEAKLTDESGASLSDREVTFGLAGKEETTTTGSDGIARATFVLEAKPGSYTAIAAFAGDEDFLASQASVPFEIMRKDTAMTLTVDGQGVNRTLTARLFPDDREDAGIAEREITFYADGNEIGTAVTDADGTATLGVPPRYRGGPHTFRVEFSGDEFFLGSEASASSR